MNFPQPQQIPTHRVVIDPVATGGWRATCSCGRTFTTRAYRSAKFWRSTHVQAVR